MRRLTVRTRMQRFCCCISLVVFCLTHGVGYAGTISTAGFTVGEEREVGEQLLALVRQEFKLLDDPDIVQYVRRLGREIVKTAGPGFFDYHFFVIKNRELNAFAAPSGLVFLHTGLIERMDHENELVSVMAHEVAHVASRHFAKRMDKSTKVNIGAMALVLAGIAMGAGPVSQALISGSMAASASMQLRFSRQDEEEADRLAFTWMQQEQRDPAGMVDMLRELRRVNRFQSGAIPSYLLTHPAPEQRLGYVQDLVLFAGPRAYPLVDEFEFRRIKTRIQAQTREPTGLMAHYRNRLATLKPGSADAAMARYGLALGYLSLADFVAAEKEMRQVVRAVPDQPLLLVDLGVILFESGRYRDALPLFQAALAKDADCGYATYYVARALEQTGRPLQAEAMYLDLLQAIPDYAKLYYQLGKIKAGQGEVAESYYYLGAYYWNEGKTMLARKNLTRAIAGLGDNPKLKAKAEALLERMKRIEAL